MENRILIRRNEFVKAMNKTNSSSVIEVKDIKMQVIENKDEQEGRTKLDTVLYFILRAFSFMTLKCSTCHPQNMPLWHRDYLEVKPTGNQTQEKLSA